MVKKVRYLWDDAEDRFLRVRGLERGVTYTDAHAHSGLSSEDAKARRLLYGLNEIVVPLQSILTLILLEVANAFYVFQVFTLVVWFVEGYVYYTIAIIIMSVTSVSTSVMQIRKVRFESQRPKCILTGEERRLRTRKIRCVNPKWRELG